jgi:hypothetical protein
VNHRAQAGVETVFATRRRLIDRNPGFCVKNFGDCQDFAFRGALKGQDVGVLGFHFGEFVSRDWCVGAEKTTGQKRDVASDNDKNNTSHSNSSVR